MLRMCDVCKDVLDTDQDGSSVSTKWGDNMELRLPHFVLTEHTLVIVLLMYLCAFQVLHVVMGTRINSSI